jgi:hypothetical protein
MLVLLNRKSSLCCRFLHGLPNLGARIPSHKTDLGQRVKNPKNPSFALTLNSFGR